ncbi:MAG: insulinase family protein [Deltaproteobacteria bacterium]|nr:MAG: insulinase family protein [Deltaproteobacteria bacterium]
MIRPLVKFVSTAAALVLAGQVVATPATAAPAPKKAKAAKTTKAKTKKKKKGDLEIDLPVQTFTLDNGLRVIVLEDHSTPAFALSIAYNVGSRDEEEGRTGFAHLFEHMMFKGSKNVPDGGHFKYILGVGGEMNAFTSADVTQYYDVVPSHYLDMVLWLESDRMRSLEVTEENFENQRAAVKEEKAMRVDNAPYIGVILDVFSDLWKGTGYGHPTIGSLEDLNAAQTEDVQAFFNRYYVPNNAVMSIVGDVEFDEVKRKVEKYFGDIPRGPDREKFQPIEHVQEKIEIEREDKLARQPLYLIGWKTVPEYHPDAKPLEILLNILLRGDSSRITRILKDEKKLVIASIPISGLGGGRDAGMASAAFIPVEGASFDEIKKVVVEEVEKVKKKGISKKELQKAINQLTVDTVEQLATNLNRALLTAQHELFYDDPKHILTDLDEYRAVTVKDLKRVANKYLTDKWVTVAVMPKKK